MVIVIAYAHKPLNNFRIIANSQFENLSVQKFKLTCPIEKPTVFLSREFQVRFCYRVNIGWETVTGNGVNNAVCQLINLKIQCYFSVFFHLAKLQKRHEFLAKRFICAFTILVQLRLVCMEIYSLKTLKFFLS